MQTIKMNFSLFTPQYVIELIKGTLSGINQQIKQSTKILKAYTKHASSIRILSFLLMNSNDFPIRQMCTVLLRRNLVNLYQSLNIDEKKQFKDLLLNQYAKENSLLIQRGIAVLIGMLLPIVQLKNWPELQGLLDKAFQSAPDSPATFVLLNSLLYHFTPPKQLYGYLINALSNQKLVQEAIKCLVAVVETQDVDQSVATKLIDIWSKSFWTQQISLVCFEVLTIMCERKIKLSDQTIQWVCDGVVANKKVSKKIRSAGLDLLFSVAEFQSRQLNNKENLTKKIVQCACIVCSEPHHHNEAQEFQGQLIQQISLWLIETLSVSLKTKKIYPILLDASISLINSEDVDKINTGYLVLAATTEGCAQKVKKNLQNPIMNVLIPKGLAHTAPQVRGAAINTLCYFSQYLIPDIIEYHSTIIPSMIGYINDLSPKVAQKALIAIDVFFDSMEQKDITGYLPIVIPKLTQALLNQKSTPLMRKAAMSSIGGAISAAQLAFQPYVNDLFKNCINILQISPSAQLNSVRAQNIMVLGKLANCFTKKSYSNQKLFFDTYIIPILQPIYEMLVNQQDPQIKQACFAFFYLLANAIQNQFQFIFDKIIIEIMKGCEMKMPQKAKQQFSLDSDSQQEDEGMHSTKSAVYDQKAAAIHALGQLAKACPMKFSNHFQRAYQILDQNHQFFYESVRVQVSTCYVNLTLGYIKFVNQGIIPPFQNGLPCSNRYPQKVELFFKAQLIPKLIYMMTQDQSSKACCNAIESLDQLIKNLGPALIDNSIQAIKDAIIRLLESQCAEEDSEQQQNQEEDDTDAYIFEPICDLLPRLCQTLKLGSEPTLNELHPYLMKYLEERDDMNDNIQMVGCLSQVFKHVPSYVVAHHEELFRSILDLINLWDTDLNRNIAYCFAEMFQKASNVMIVYIQDALVGLKNIFQHANSSEACKDNAIAALCRITYTIYPTMPYEAIVNNLIQRMPFKGDQQQQASAVKGLLFLAEKNPMLLQPHLGRIKQIFNHDISQPQKYYLNPQLISKMKNLLEKI